MSLNLPITIKDFPSHNRVSGVMKESSLLPHFVPKILILNFLRISSCPTVLPIQLWGIVTSKIAFSLSSADHVLDYIELDSENAIFEVTIPQSWMGKTGGQLDIRKKFNINILGTKCGSKLDSFITPDTLLCEGKSLMVMGRFKDIQKCFRI